jgi:hypothetical protein
MVLTTRYASAIAPQTVAASLATQVLPSLMVIGFAVAALGDHQKSKQKAKWAALKVMLRTCILFRISVHVRRVEGSNSIFLELQFSFVRISCTQFLFPHSCKSFSLASAWFFFVKCIICIHGHR